MMDGIKSGFTQRYSFSIEEQNEIDQKVTFELNEAQRKMVLAGGIVNSLAGLFVIYVLYNKIKVSLLISWFIVLVSINIINNIYSFYYHYRRIAPQQIKSWRRIYHFILALLAMAWGSIGVLFISNDIYYQLYIMTFLQIALVAFSFGTITDFTATIVSVVSLLFPYIIFRIFSQKFSMFMIGYDQNLNITFSITLSILGIFLLVASYIGYRLIKESFKLNFINIALNQKLESMNKLLEKRVAERTVELENSLKKVTYQATHDLLTDLPNHRLLIENLQSAISVAKQKTHMLAVVCLSINEMEKIYDGLGHQLGDQTIQTIAQRFKKKWFNGRSSKDIHYMVTVSRKDKFIIIMQPFFRLKDIEIGADNLFSITKTPIYFEKQTIKLTISMGVSIYPNDSQDIKSLLMNADAAMLLAKQRGGNSLNIYRPGINIDISKQLEMASYLHDAIKNNEFLLKYQPLVNIETGKIFGAEALIRWESPLLGIISPEDFIPIAEANGIIIPLGEWVLKIACFQIKTWQDADFDPIIIAINLSAKQLEQKDILQKITKILELTHLKPSNLELELTEKIAFREETIPILKELKTLGIRLSIDDFGTGYSGLSNLKQLNIDTLKIDRSFVSDVCTNKDSQAIVSNIIALAHEMHINVVAEGVETEEQMNLLKKYGCNLMQGYYFSHPLSSDDFIKLLKQAKI